MSRWVEWVEPFGPEDEPVYMRVTVEVATASAIAVAAKQGHYYNSRQQALDDFLVTHWAEVRDGTEPLEKQWP